MRETKRGMNTSPVKRYQTVVVGRLQILAGHLRIRLSQNVYLVFEVVLLEVVHNKLWCLSFMQLMT